MPLDCKQTLQCTELLSCEISIAPAAAILQLYTHAESDMDAGHSSPSQSTASACFQVIEDPHAQFHPSKPQYVPLALSLCCCLTTTLAYDLTWECTMQWLPRFSTWK